MKILVMTFVMITIVGCESLQEMNGVPTNTSSTVIDNVREQNEQTIEISDSTINISGAFLTFWVSAKLGGAVLAIGVLTVGFASASQFYLEEIALIGLIVLVIGFFATLGILAWLLLDGKNDKHAIKEIVGLVESLKSHLSEKERQSVFGPKGIASKATSDITKRVIAQIKIKNGFKTPED